MKLAKTESGQLAFKARSPVFSSRQRAAFILFDGKKTIASILGATTALGLTQADIDYLLERGLLAPVQEPVASEPPNPWIDEPPLMPAVREDGDDHGTTHVDRWTMF